MKWEPALSPIPFYYSETEKVFFKKYVLHHLFLASSVFENK